jgi:uncharacterized damage-inducible protein DinB
VLVNIGELLAEEFGRIRGVVLGAVRGLSEEELAFRPYDRGNSIAWLIWHLTRIQDDHVAAVAGTGQAWMSEGWAERCALPFPVAETGYGHSSAEVAAVRVPGDLLVGYHEAVFGHTIKYVQGLIEADLDRVVDEHWDPPVTLGVRLVSVISDDLQHGGQAAYVRGLLPAR